MSAMQKMEAVCALEMKRWSVAIIYRANEGLHTQTFEIDEISEMHDLVEYCGIHWAALDHIEVRYLDPAGVGRLTQEQAFMLR